MGSDPKLTNGSLIAERYRVFDEKRGGMGRVFFCHDIKNNQNEDICVLKTLHDDLIYNTDARGRFENEASAWLSLGDISDNYVLSLLEILQHDGLPFLRMNFCCNGSLADKLSQGQIPIMEVIRYSTQLLIGMQLIDGTYNLVHRDLKPGNILLDSQNNVKVSDLGLVKTIQNASTVNKVNLQNTSLTQFRGFIGTIQYAAPEQILGLSDLDQRVDIWAYGVILYEMLTMRNPFKANTIDSFVENVLSLDPPHIKSISDLPNKQVGSIIMKCLEKKRENRYSSFRDLISDWDAVIKVKNSPKHQNPFSSDKRILLEIPFVDHMWIEFFPDRIKVSQYTMNVSALRGIEEASNYRKIGNYEASLLSYDKVLGFQDDKECYLNDFIENYHQMLLKDGTLSLVPGIKDDKTNLKSIFTPAPWQVREALLGKMVVLVDIIEERQNISDYKEMIKSYASRILKANIPDAGLRCLAAQALILNNEFNEAFELLLRLIEEYPNDATYEQVLLLCLKKMGDKEKTLEFCNRIIKKNWEKTDYRSLYFCAQASSIAKDYKNCVFFAEKANAENPYNISCLQKLCSAHLHSGNMDKAIDYYKQMVKVDAKSNLTINLGKSISSVIETHKAAENENSDAQFSLFAMYIRGDAVPQDEEKAIFWLQKAAGNKHKEAIEFLKKFTKKQ